MTSLLLHCLNAAILFLLLDDLTRCKGRSFLVAMLFAIHPLNVQSVAWISEKKNLLSTLFLFLAIGAYTRYVRRPGLWRYVAVLVLFALGLMSKPMIVTFPFLLLLLDYWPLARFRFEEEKNYGLSEQLPNSEPRLRHTGKSIRHIWGRLLVEKVPFILLAVASGIVTVIAQQSLSAITDAEYSLTTRLENALISYVSYIAKMFWPVHLAVYYPHPGNSVSFWHALFAFFLLLAITALVIWKRDHKYMLTGWLVYLGTLVPVIGIVQVGSQSMADRYGYIPLIGLFIVVAWGAADFCAHISVPGIKAAAYMLILCILTALAMDTRAQLAYWHDGLLLFSHAAAVTPENDTTSSKLAEALEASGRLDEALAEFESYLARHPNDASAQYNAAAALLRRGRIEDAIDGLQRAVTLARTPYVLAHTHYQLGNILLKSGDMNSAEKHYRAAVEISPTEYDAHLKLALILEQHGRQEEAIAHLRQAANAEKPDSAYFYLGQAYESEGRLSEALAAYKQALTVVPESEQIRAAIATVQHKH